MNKNYQYLSGEHAQYIKDIIKEVENRDKNYEIFGAERPCFSFEKYRFY